MADITVEALAQLLEKQNKALEGLSERIELQTKTAATAQTANKLHGANGIFSSAAIERDVITAHVTPRGIASRMPFLPNVTEDPRFASITGVSDVVGSQPAKVCDDAPVAYMKGCNLTALFALTRFDTNTIDIYHTMLKLNRGDPGDLVLRGKLLGMDLAPSGLNQAEVLNILTMSEMVTVGVSTERKLSKDIFQGTVAGGTFPGIDAQVVTGIKDADSGTLCPALDSDVKDFAYDKVGGTGRDIVEYLSMLEFYLRTNALTMGLDPTTWVIAMRPELWYELSAVWPCSYLSNKCNNSAGTPIAVINDTSNVTMRDAMRNGKYIDINGNRYDVVEDTGIFEYNNINSASCRAGEYASSIYMLPMTITGGFPVLYREYLNYSLASLDERVLGGLPTFWTDSGAFGWAIEAIKWCFKLALRTEQRVILRTPQLAGKIQRVKYSPLQHLRDSDPQGPYFKDGGVSTRSYTWGQAVWK